MLFAIYLLKLVSRSPTDLTVVSRELQVPTVGDTIYERLANCPAFQALAKGWTRALDFTLR